METFWIELIKQAPGIGAIVFLVMVFLKYMRAQSQDMQATFKEIRDSCHDFHGKVNDVNVLAITRCSNSLDANNVTLGRNIQVIERYAKAN